MADMKRVVVVGYGGMGSWHVKQILSHKTVKLAGIYDIDLSKVQWARENQGLFGYDTLDDVLDDPIVDIVTIAVPNNFHKEIAIRALEAGKNVISEKPVTLSSADLEEMISAAERNHRIFSVHQNRRWDSDFIKAKEIVNSGMLGNIAGIESRVHGCRGIPNDWRRTAEAGGGMVYDWGVHLIDQALQIIPEKVVSVFCRLDHITNEIVDDGCRIYIKFESGKYYLVEVGTTNFEQLPRWYILGSIGTACIKGWSGPAEIVRCREWNEKEVIPVVTAAGITKTMAPRNDDSVIRDSLPLDRSEVHEYYQNFADAIDGKCEQIVTHAQMRRVMKVIETAFESARLNEVIHTEI